MPVPVFWFRLLVLAQVALLAKRHLDRLEAAERSELRAIVAKSRGRPRNLTAAERDRLRELVAKLEPIAFGRDAATRLVGLRRRR